MSVAGTSAKLGIVVIGRNEGERLARCLASLQATEAPIAYADSASTDDSLRTARAAGAIAVEVDPTLPMNAARGRNAGLMALRQAHGDLEYVQFIDGDCELDASWTPTAIDFLDAHPRAAVACGRRFEKHPEASPYNRMCDEEWDTRIGLAPACGGDAMVRLSALDQAGPFDPTLMAGEEPELCSRLRALDWEIWRLDALMTRHDAAMTRLGQWTRRATRSGYGYAQAWLRTRGRADRLYGAQLRSALLWAAVIPLGVVLVAAGYRQPAILLALPIIYALQLGRIAMRRGLFLSWSWRYAALMLVAKFPELLGALTFALRRVAIASIDYKKLPK